MRLFVSSDIEGTTGITDWQETEKGEKAYEYFAEQMSREVSSACKGALESGRVDDILVVDAHDLARNIVPAMLPRGVRIERGWQDAPCDMMSGVMNGFDMAAMTGYHSAAYTDGNPLSHTNNRRNQFLRINEEPASEFMINAMFAAYYKVPTVFVSGDLALCESAKKLIPGITAVAVSESIGGASISLHPEDACDLIYEGVKTAVKGDISRCLMVLPEHFHVEIEYKEYIYAYRGSFYPGAKKVGAKGLEFETDDFYEAARFLFFVS